MTEGEERVLVFAPIGRDASLTRDLLARARIAAVVCDADDEVVRRLEDEGAAALMLAEETLTPRAVARLNAYLDAQPAWSDLPILVFSNAEGTLRRINAAVVGRLGNVALLDRPLRPITMISAVQAALRARRRQYALRDELRSRELAVQRRDEFLAMLGHELRNPLSAMLMALEALEIGGPDPGKYRGILRRQAQHLARLVDDLLDVSRVTSGKVSLQRAPLDLARLVRRCVASLEAASRDHELVVETRTPARRIAVSGDAVRLEQVVVNLVSNAIKYTPRRGHVLVEVSNEDDQAVLSVSDDGAGLSAELLPRIFELFTQAPETLDRAKGGLGIGLTLVRSLVELHGGSVTAASDGPGRGSRFTVRLPLAAAAAPVRAAPAPRRAGVAHEVLIVEDNADSRDTLKVVLEELGHKVEVACDGLEAVERARAAPPEVAVVDIGLPGIDGYEVARRLRAERGRSVYLIALTGYGQPEDRLRAFEAGFDLHFTKPVDLGALGQVLARSDLVPA